MPQVGQRWDGNRPGGAAKVGLRSGAVIETLLMNERPSSNATAAMAMMVAVVAPLAKRLKWDAWQRDEKIL